MTEMRTALESLVKQAVHKGRDEARNQILQIIRGMLDVPNFASMSNVEVVRYLVDAVALEFRHDSPGATDVQS